MTTPRQFRLTTEDMQVLDEGLRVMGQPARPTKPHRHHQGRHPPGARQRAKEFTRQGPHPKETAPMSPNQLRQAITHKPFRPFQIMLDDGRTLTVDHPEFIAVSRTGREVTFYADRDAQHWLDARLIRESIVLPQAEPATPRQDAAPDTETDNETTNPPPS